MSGEFRAEPKTGDQPDRQPEAWPGAGIAAAAIGCPGQRRQEYRWVVAGRRPRGVRGWWSSSARRTRPAAAFS